MSLRKHNLYRAYIALAREEHYAPSELGECLNDDWEDGLLVQINWAYCPKLAKKLELNYAQIWEQMIIPKPSKIEHMVYSAALRRLDPNFEIQLLAGHGYLQPIRDGHFITQLEFKQLWF